MSSSRHQAKAGAAERDRERDIKDFPTPLPPSPLSSPHRSRRLLRAGKSMKSTPSSPFSFDRSFVFFLLQPSVPHRCRFSSDSRALASVFISHLHHPACLFSAFAAADAVARKLARRSRLHVFPSAAAALSGAASSSLSLLLSFILLLLLLLIRLSPGLSSFGLFLAAVRLTLLFYHSGLSIRLDYYGRLHGC